MVEGIASIQQIVIAFFEFLAEGYAVANRLSLLLGQGRGLLAQASSLAPLGLREATDANCPVSTSWFLLATAGVAVSVLLASER